MLSVQKRIYKKPIFLTPKGKSPVLKKNIHFPTEISEKVTKKHQKMKTTAEEVDKMEDSVEELKNLSKNIDKMCGKFNKHKLVLTPVKHNRHSSNPQIIKATPYREFKQQLIDQFSFIKKFDSAPKIGQKKSIKKGGEEKKITTKISSQEFLKQRNHSK